MTSCFISKTLEPVLRQCVAQSIGGVNEKATRVLADAPLMYTYERIFKRYPNFEPSVRFTSQWNRPPSTTTTTTATTTTTTRLRISPISTGVPDQIVFKSKYWQEIPQTNFFDYVLGDISGDENKTAIVDGISGRSMSYAQLKDNSIRLGRSMVERGYKRGDVIGILSPNAIEYMITLFGCSYVGVAATLLNPLETEATLQHQLQETSAKSLFVFPSLARKAAKIISSVPAIRDVFIFGVPFVPNGAVDLFRRLSIRGVNSSGFNQLLRGSDPEVHSFQPPDLNPENDVLIIPFSSGTTGLPKGVIHTHSTIIAFTDVIYQQPDFQRLADIEKNIFTSLALLPFFHIFGYAIALTAFKFRGTNVTNPRFHKRLFLRTIQKYKILVIAAVPPLLDFLAYSPLVEKYDLSSVRIIVSGAAPLSKVSVDRLLKKFQNLRVEQGLGLTETNICCTIDQYSPFTSVGTLFPNGEAKVIDIVSGKELGLNEAGELVVNTPSVMKGYLNNPEATDAAFLSDNNGKKWLRTGDVGYFDDMENIYVVDRIKEMIKYKGHQVSPVEIEQTIRKLSGVVDVGVIGVADAVAGEVPLALVVKEASSTVNEKDVMVFVAKSMTPYNHLRGGVIFTKKIPRSISGKILRRELKNRVE